MRTTLLLLLLLMCASAVARDQVTNHQTYAGSVLVGDPISKVQMSFGRADRTYEIQNAYGGVVGFDYVWNRGNIEVTFVVTPDGMISSIWQADAI